MSPCSGMIALAITFWKRSILLADFTSLPRCVESACSRKHLQSSIPAWHAATEQGQLVTSDGMLLPGSAYCGHPKGLCWNLGHQYASSWDTGRTVVHSQNVFPESYMHNVHMGNRFPFSGNCPCHFLQCHNEPGASLQTKAIAYAVWAHNSTLPSGCILDEGLLWRKESHHWALVQDHLLQAGYCRNPWVEHLDKADLIDIPYVEMEQPTPMRVFWNKKVFKKNYKINISLIEWTCRSIHGCIVLSRSLCFVVCWQMQIPKPNSSRKKWRDSFDPCVWWSCSSYASFLSSLCTDFVWYFQVPLPRQRCRGWGSLQDAMLDRRAMKKTLVVYGICRGWNTTQVYRDYNKPL